MKRDYRKYYRIFLALFVLSLGTNLFLLTLYLKDKKISFPSISSYVKTHLAKKEVAREVAKEEKKPKGKIPVPLVYIDPKVHFLLCEKNSNTLYLYRSEGVQFPLVKTFPCILGSNNGDKREAGDLATPEGVYFLVSSLMGKGLPEKYGHGAFSLNYPNLLDQKEGKKGGGIWLHGSPDQAERPPYSEGCVVVRNEILKELAGFIKIGDTPMVIVDTLQYHTEEDHQRLSQGLSHFLEDWKGAWEGLDTERYLGFYSKDFINSQGMNYQRFKEHKERVNRTKKFIKLQIEKKSFLLSQKNSGRIAVLRINQDYRSDNFHSYTRKILYLREEQGGWKIIGEAAL